MLKRYPLTAGICLSALLISQQSFAQETESGNVLQEIVVTAQKRSENLQKVPIAVSAVNPERLAEAGVQNTQDLAAALPGLQLLNIAGNVTPRVRGVGSGFTAAGFESPVATYVDGVYLSYGADVNMDLSDVSQVALIKGPQGTLFGRNATGGVLQITTRAPEYDFNGSFRVGLDNYLTMRGDAFVTGGLSDTVAASLAVSYTHQGEGWGENKFTGNDTYKTDRAFSIRGKIRAEISDATTVVLSADYANRKGTTAVNFSPFPGTTTVLTYNDPALLAAQPKRAWDINNFIDAENRFEGGGGSITVDHDFGGTKLTSITSFRDAKAFFYFTPVPIPIETFEAGVPESSRTFTQELQLSNDTGPLIWTVGAYYFHNKATQNQTNYYHPAFGQGLAIQITGDPADGPAIFPFVRELFPVEVRAESVAAYAQATYSITPSTRLTGGIRYTWQKSKFAGSDILVLPDGTEVPAFVVPDGESSTFKKPTWRLSLDHDFAPNITGFVSYNRGVKSGGYNIRNPANAAYKPERLDAYEVGVKSELFDRIARVNVSGFYYKYANIQVPKFDTTAIISNGAKAELYGLDLDMEARLTSQLTINGGLTWLHTEFLSFDEAPTATFLPGGYPGLGFQTDASGMDIPYSPHLTYVIGATYTVPTSSGDFAFNVTDSYNSGFYSEADNFLRQDSYHFLNASLSWTSNDESLTARVYVNNILNEAVASQFPTISGFGYIADYTNPPRIIGGSIGIKF